MADTLYIANGALSLVGQGIILSLQDNTPAAKQCALHLPQAVREVLALGKWKSARKEAMLGQLTGTPSFGWSYAYQLPEDYIRTISINDVDPHNVIRTLWDIQGKQVLTDEAFIDLVYVCDLTAAGNDISAAHPLLIECMVVKLAQKLAWPMQQARTLKESLEQEFQYKLKVALGVDAKQTREPLVNPASESTWLRSRMSSTNG